jgi:hypothetical protein
LGEGLVPSRAPQRGSIARDGRMMLMQSQLRDLDSESPPTD